MKKIIIFFALITIVINAFGQIPNMESVLKRLSDSGSVYTQKVQQWNTDTLIVLSQAKDSSSYSFYLITGNNNTAYQTTLVLSDVVKDFKIFNNTIWFCGSIVPPFTGSPAGFIAYASLQDLFVNQSYYIRDTKPMLSLDKIEICIDPNTHNTIICGIGKDHFEQSFFYSDDAAHISLVFPAPNANEIFDDIIIKQDYTNPNNPINRAFVVGRSTLLPNILGVRQFDISNPFNNAGSYNIIPNSINMFFTEPLVADSLTYKFIAVAGIMTNNIGSFEEINVFKIDIYNPQAAIIDEILFDGNSIAANFSLKDLMLYSINPNHYKLLLLGYFPMIPNATSSVIDIDFINHSFLNDFAHIYFPPTNILFNSFTKNNLQKIIITGIEHNININTFEVNPLHILPNDCYAIDSTSMHYRDFIINPSPLQSITTPQEARFNWWQRHAQGYSQNINIICQ
ncbi:MAG: hypothetical protein LBM25_03910 [Bacteroidales bacterium]|jgi:hypothetical protein|nr:hypothetical protein [Bacteroidales bacterium]